MQLIPSLRRSNREGSVAAPKPEIFSFSVFHLSRFVLRSCFAVLSAWRVSRCQNTS